MSSGFIQASNLDATFRALRGGDPSKMNNIPSSEDYKTIPKQNYAPTSSVSGAFNAGMNRFAASSGGGVTPTATKTTNYTAISGDYVVLNVSSAAVVTMPASPTNGATVGAINLATSTASVTFAAGAGATMNNTSVVLNSNQDAVWVYNSNTTSWLLIDWNATNEYQVQGIMGFY